MNFYSFHIGDYAGATRHLSWDEDMAYRRMLDAYYSRELPLPADRKALYRLVGAHEKRQKSAVDMVLEEFFELFDDGWRNSRCDEEIAKATEKAVESAERRDNEKERQRRHRIRRKELFDTLRSYGVVPPYDATTQALEDMVTKRNGHTHVTDPVTRDATANNPNPNPNPNIDRMGEVSARDPDAYLEATLRKAAGWGNHPAPMLAVTGPIQALIDAGADLDLDVLPVIQAYAPRVRSPGWNYFINAIAQARDERIAAATVVSMPTSSSRSTSHAARRQKPSRDETFAAIDQRIAEFAEAERRQAGGSQDRFVEPDEGAA